MSDAAPAYYAYVRGWGPGVIGYIFALWLSGLTVGQMVFYLKVYANDHKGIKAAVVFVFVLDMVHTYCTSALFWRLLVSCRRNTSHECLLLPQEMFVCARMIRACSCSVTDGLILGWYLSQCNENLHLFG
ncbi:hypothetical protein EDD22DRAFT_36838 [Suillus occidentalis]|nr:hypothetical protein EDD22DRAFT_36838 [Suillus occidentalis]